MAGSFELISSVLVLMTFIYLTCTMVSYLNELVKFKKIISNLSSSLDGQDGHPTAFSGWKEIVTVINAF